MAAIRHATGADMKWLWLALCLAWFSPVRAESRLGRLFFSPEQRLALDRIKAQPPAPEDAVAEQAPPVRARFDGVLRTSSGGSTAFVDGKSVPVRELPSGIRVGEYFETREKMMPAKPENKSVAATGQRSGP